MATRPMAGRYLTLKDMTGGSGCTPRTVRYYERQGLLRAARSAGGHRLFAAAELERLNFIIGLREAGWTLEEVETLLSAREDAPTDRDAARRLDGMLTAQIERLEQKIALLSKLRVDLAGTHELLRVCGGCTTRGERVECEACDRVPPLHQLPHGFRLTWRSRELSEAAFDDPSADGDDAATDDGPAAQTLPSSAGEV